jgi:hypothetical protein
MYPENNMRDETTSPVRHAVAAPDNTEVQQRTHCTAVDDALWGA